MSKTNIAIFASGSGSTAEALIRDIQEKGYPLNVKLMITNNQDAFVRERIKNLNKEYSLGITSVVLNSSTQPSASAILTGQQTEEEQAAMLALLKENGIELVLLLGYMKLVGTTLLEAYGWLPEYESVYQCRMLNTHPGLLPETVGTHGIGTQEFTIREGLREAGQTLHAVSAEYDMGPTVAVHRVPIEPNDTPEALFSRVQAVEKATIASDIAAFVEAQKKYRKEQ
ncbi:hypothetical protein IPL85_01030 [Candidatus Saccharibacteria bacterium]|nr:MAG: hypothetical protein IPL85_01030 [Candidatus Saccharibacteria bacterium]